MKKLTFIKRAYVTKQKTIVNTSRPTDLVDHLPGTLGPTESPPPDAAPTGGDGDLLLDLTLLAGESKKRIVCTHSAVARGALGEQGGPGDWRRRLAAAATKMEARWLLPCAAAPDLGLETAAAPFFTRSVTTIGSDYDR